ncbi:MAG: exonuclease SbcCD subunit D [Pyrodictiaceae archaeon]
MASIHVLHVADTHLGYRQYGIIDREKDIYEAFSEVVEIALSEHVDLVVHAGDFFDTARPPPQAILSAIRGLRKLKEKGIPVYAVLGDHDTPKRVSTPPLIVLEELGYLHVLGYKASPENYRLRARTRSGEVFVAGVSNLKGIMTRVLPERLKLVSSPPHGIPSILILHQALREFSPFYELSVTELPRGYSYYALGHIHTYNSMRLGEPLLAYPGAPEILKVDEIDDKGKGVIIAEVSAKGTISASLVKIKTLRPQYKLELEASSTEELREKLLQALTTLRPGRTGKKPILHLKIKGQVAVNKKMVYTLIEKLIAGRLLAYRLNLEAPIAKEASEALELEGLDIRRLIEAKLRDKQLADLAYKLLMILGYSQGQKAVDDALALLKSYIEARYGVKP